MTTCSRAFAVGEHRELPVRRGRHEQAEGQQPGPAHDMCQGRTFAGCSSLSARRLNPGRSDEAVGAVELSRVELVVMGLLPRQRGEGGELELRCEGPHSVGVAGSQPFQGAEG